MLRMVLAERGWHWLARTCGSCWKSSLNLKRITVARSGLWTEVMLYLVIGTVRYERE